MREDEKTFAVWLFMDDDSKERLKRKGMQEGNTSCNTVIEELEMVRNEGITRKALTEYSKRQSDKMDLSMVAAGAAQRDQEEQESVGFHSIN